MQADPVMTTHKPVADIRFSVIVPVYNRIDEVADLLKSLAAQSDQGFEAIIVEDGSTEPCRDVCRRYEGVIDLQYHYKDNEGRSIARNYGILRAGGDYLSSSTLTAYCPLTISRHCAANLTRLIPTASEVLTPPTNHSARCKKP